MFRRETVFVVGAGASKELGLPTGAELSEKIAAAAESAKFDGRGLPINKGAVAMRQTMSWGLGHQSTQNALNARLAALQDIGRAIYLKDSIDAVIDQYHQRPEIAEVGKYLIADFIWQAEANSLLKPERPEYPNGAPRLRNGDNSWLKTFARMLFEGVRLNNLDELGERVTIICFNYDRCIERYLIYAIVETYSLSVDEAIKVAAQVKIVHVYGSLGPLPGWPSPPNLGGALEVAFGASSTPSPWLVAQGLRTFSESVESIMDNQIKEAIARADQYVYLGLSFGRQNMDLLSVEKVVGAAMPPERDVYASGFGQSEQGRKAICRLLQRTYSPGPLPIDRSVLDRTHVELKATSRALLDDHWHNILG